MDYTTRLDEEGQAHVNYECPCGCEAGLIYSKERGTTAPGHCCCGRILWVGDEAEAEVRRLQVDGTDYELDVTRVTLPWGELATVALAVPVERSTEEQATAPAHGHDHGSHHGHDQEAHGPARQQSAGSGIVIDPVCGMTIDAATAAGQSDYGGKTYYFCALGCKTRFDANPKQFAEPTGLLDRFRRQ